MLPLKSNSPEFGGIKMNNLPKEELLTDAQRTRVYAVVGLGFRKYVTKAQFIIKS
jgi:hypothetical protein